MMLAPVAELLLALIDLLRAELRDARRGVLRLVVSLCLVVVAALLLASALGLGLAATYWALVPFLPPPAAMLITAGVCLLVAAVVLAIGFLSVPSR